MTFSAYASHAPRNMYAAQRAGVKLAAHDRDVHAKRRSTNALFVGLLIAVNIVLLGAVVPVVNSAIHSVSLPSLILSAPQH